MDNKPSNIQRSSTKICSICNKKISYSNYSAHFKKCSQNTNVEKLIQQNDRLLIELKMMTQNYVEAQTKVDELENANNKLFEIHKLLIAKFANVPINLKLD